MGSMNVHRRPCPVLDSQQAEDETIFPFKKLPAAEKTLKYRLV
jgi:hypothetical protein